MGFREPTQPNFDVDEWATLPYPERVRAMCGAWVLQGFGAPGVAYVFYVLKIGLYLGGFLFFATRTRGVGGIGDFTDWWAEPIVFAKLVLWTLLFEALGLGCGSGPLTGRYVPPVTACAAFLRPGTTRLPPFPALPGCRGHHRNIGDVALYALFLLTTINALVADEISRSTVAPIIVTMVLLGFRDKTAFLAARSEHFLLATFVLMFPADFIPGQKAIQAALWFGAASSKLNRHFPSVVSVMLSNNPLLRSKRLRRKLYRNFPDDLTSSRTAALVAHTGTFIEYLFPLLLVFGGGGWVTTIGLVIMVAFHLNILLSFPLGVPLEWNVFFIYSGLALYGVHAEVPLWDISSPLLALVLVLLLVVVPVAGNIRPDRISFLPAMRYYAGNWAVSAWLLRPGLLEEIEDGITTPSSTPGRQLAKLYGDQADVRSIIGRTQAFRSMHLHGRAINCLLPIAIEDLLESDAGVRAKGVDAFEVIDGELVAGLVLGWNFGEGHLHNEQLVEALQDDLHFEPGEVRVVMLEGQGVGDPTLRWRIVDAAQGRIAEGRVTVTDLIEVPPWANDGLDVGRLPLGEAGW